ncbi:MAG: EAL domain-containing protein, partial [Clostridia bacterium]|nr:EAL domain-containing protein [Clostridia bacterium]
CVSDKREVGIELLKHNIQHAITALTLFEKANIDLDFLSIRCPADIIDKLSLYDIVSEILQKNPKFDSSKLCFEFPATILDKDTERAKTALLDMKLLKIRTAIVGGGDENFLLSKIVQVTPNIVFLTPTATAWGGNRNKPELLKSLTAYIKSMGAEVIAEGRDINRKGLRGVECLGFLDVGGEALSLDDALARKREKI